MAKLYLHANALSRYYWNQLDHIQANHSIDIRVWCQKTLDSVESTDEFGM